MWGFDWWKKRQERRKAEKADMEAKSLAALMRGVQHCVASTRALLAKSQLDAIDQFFDVITIKDEAGNLRQYYVPRMITMPVGNDHVTHIPLYTIVKPNVIDLDTLEMHMSVRIEETVIKKATSELDKSEADRVSMKVSMQPKGLSGASRRADTTDVSFKFKASEPPEAIMRLMEQYTNLIQPVPRSDLDNKVLKDISVTDGITAYALADEAKSESFVNEAGKLDTMRVTKPVAKEDSETPEAHDFEPPDDDGGIEPIVVEDDENG